MNVASFAPQHTGVLRATAQYLTRNRFSGAQRRSLEISSVSRMAYGSHHGRGGFAPDMLAGLVPAGLATVVTETVRAPFLTIMIYRSQITDAGQRRLRRWPLEPGPAPVISPAALKNRVAFPFD